MTHRIWLLTTIFLLAAGSAAFGQEAAPIAESAESVATTGDDADRAYVREVLSRDEVRTAASIGGADLDRALDNVSSLEGDRLERATQQARLVDQTLGSSAQDGISFSATTLIIILVLVVIVILIA